jgi:hypothetical protein
VAENIAERHPGPEFMPVCPDAANPMAPRHEKPAHMRIAERRGRCVAAARRWPELKFCTDLTDKVTKEERRLSYLGVTPGSAPFLSLAGPALAVTENRCFPHIPNRGRVGL